MLPSADPLARPAFGGSEQQIAEIANYRRALKDLQTKHEKKEHEGDEAQDQAEVADEKAKGRNRRRGPEKQ